eukprot:g546.t1
MSGDATVSSSESGDLGSASGLETKSTGADDADSAGEIAERDERDEQNTIETRDVAQRPKACPNPYDPSALDAWRGTNLGDPYLKSITSSEERGLNLLVARIKHLGKFYPYLDRLTALRFLRARDGNVDMAEEMFRKTVAWYDANNIAEISRDPCARITGMGQTFDALPFYPGGQAGRDRDGDPVLWGRQGLVDPMTLLRRYSILELQREAVRRYETVLRMHRDDAAARGEFSEGSTGSKAHFQLTAILDVKGLGWKHTDSYGFKVLKQIQDLARDHYPELLKRALIVRPPRVFSIIWAAIKWFIDPKTRDKVVIASGSDAEILGIIEQHIERKYIPDYLGGDMVTRGLDAERLSKSDIETSGVEEKQPKESEEEWIEGLQDDGKTFKATISAGGVVPSSLFRFSKYKREHTPGKEVMLPGDPTLSKYHEDA